MSSGADFALPTQLQPYEEPGDRLVRLGLAEGRDGMYVLTLLGMEVARDLLAALADVERELDGPEGRVGFGLAYAAGGMIDLMLDLSQQPPQEQPAS